MSQEWYYSSGGERLGPVGSRELKSLASSGDLRPDDLVWKEGMGEWQPASKLKKLFPPAESRPEPVRFEEVGAAPPSLPPTAEGRPAPTTEGASASAAPALWTPKWLGLLSLFFSWGFGAFLVAKNWTAMGEPARSKVSMRWFYGFLAWIAFCVVTTPFDLPTRLFWFVACGIFVAWMVKDLTPHKKSVEERFGEDFPRKGWGMPILAGVGVLCGVMVLSCAGLLAAGGPGADTAVEMVKGGKFGNYNQATVGELLDGFLADPEWSSGDDGRVVRVEGGMTYAGKPVEATVIFDVRQDGTFEMETLELNGIPQNRLICNEFAELIVKEHRMGGG